MKDTSEAIRVLKQQKESLIKINLAKNKTQGYFDKLKEINQKIDILTNGKK